MYKKRWGMFEDDSNKKKEITNTAETIQLQNIKNERIKELSSIEFNEEHKKVIIKNPLVTQTVEVMNQIEMIKSLIDTYASKSETKYLLNPCQLMPNIDFPIKNTVNLMNDNKFAKPLWFVNPNETNFTRGIPKSIVKINRPMVTSATRMALCGLLRIIGFTDITQSALILFVDAVDEFFKQFMDVINLIIIQDNKERDKQLDVITLEKAYVSLTYKSLLTLYNYFKDDIILRNKIEIKEFKNIFQQYDKLMQESQNLHKTKIKQQNEQDLLQQQDEEYLNFLDFSNPNNNNNNSDNNEKIANIINNNDNHDNGNNNCNTKFIIIDNNQIGQIQTGNNPNNNGNLIISTAVQPTTTHDNLTQSVNTLNYLEGENNGLKELFEGELMDTTEQESLNTTN